jgi:hypothetical protein
VTTFEKIHPHANRRAPDQPQTESIIEDIGEVIESHRRCQYSWLTSGCMKFLFDALLASALVRDF